MGGIEKLSSQDKSTGLQSCVWMQAGVIDYKLCDLNYDCEHCPFDEALQGRTGVGESRLHQSLLDRTALSWPMPLTRSENVQGCEIVGALFYHQLHSWARVEEGGNVRAGVDDFGQRLLGRVYSVTLPDRNMKVQAGQECWQVCHQTGVTSLAAPVSGLVNDINARLYQNPALLNRDPYGEGWAFVIEPNDLRASLKQLRYGLRAREWFIEQIALLYDTTLSFSDSKHDLTATLPDGGVLSKEFLNELTAEEMQILINTFLTEHSRN